MASLRTLGSVTLVVAALFASCGGSDDDGDRQTLPSGHGGVGVIEGWVETLAEGDVEGAADYFAVPSVAENGAPPVTLRSHAEVVEFNRLLPCGAELIRARPAGRFIVATFRLTERPGGACGSGIGLLARTAFVVRDGKIAEWRRLPNPPQQGQGSVPIV